MANLDIKFVKVIQKNNTVTFWNYLLILGRNYLQLSSFLQVHILNLQSLGPNQKQIVSQKSPAL